MFGSSSAMLEAWPQVYQNNNGCVVGVGNCGTTTGAAKMKPQITGDVIRMGNVHVTGEAWRTPNFVVKGTGEVDIGVGSIKPIAQGLSIDAGGSKIATATWVSGAFHNVGEYIYGSNQGGTVPGAILQVAAVSPSPRGAPTALSVVDSGYSFSAASVNNASASMGTAANFIGGGNNVVTLTWADQTDGGSGVASVYIAPTSGRVTIGSGGTSVVVSGGGVQATSNFSTSAGYVSGSNSGYLWTDSANHYARMVEFTDTVTLQAPDSTNTQQSVFSYAGNSAVPQPMFIQVPVKVAAYTVAGLPTCNATMQNSLAVATDTASPAYNAIVTGASSTRIPVFCDGTNWRAH